MIKLGIVNDSVMAAECLRRVVESVPTFELLWLAYDGRQALDRCEQDCPDIILMDLIMPVMDGIEATRLINQHYHCAILVVTATVHGHAGRVFEAMGAGALDAVNTPILGTAGDEQGARTLIQKINAIATLMQGKPLRITGGTAAAERAPKDAASAPLIAIGASTGGPSAVRQVLQNLPLAINAAVTIVQHVDEQFIPSFISWLNDHSPLPVRMAMPGDSPQAGTVAVCGHEDHLVLTDKGVFDYTREHASLAYRPSVDVFFTSLSKYYVNHCVGVLLTGMGRDGAEGLKTMRERGWLTIAQDQTTCAVYGMPKAAKELDAAGKILPLDEIGPALVAWAGDIAPGSGTQRKSG
jgi:two-component system response regulator WspF